jgi:hypothetical protein
MVARAGGSTPRGRARLNWLPPRACLHKGRQRQGFKKAAGTVNIEPGARCHACQHALGYGSTQPIPSTFPSPHQPLEQAVPQGSTHTHCQALRANSNMVRPRRISLSHRLEPRHALPDSFQQPLCLPNPREATSVATRIGCPPPRNSLKTQSRSLWALSPCMHMAGKLETHTKVNACWGWGRTTINEDRDMPKSTGTVDLPVLA